MVFGVSEDILHNTGAFDARNSMFNFDPNFRHLAIAVLLASSQFFLARLFFGWHNLRTLGSYP
jgi:hypothetical protein